MNNNDKLAKLAIAKSLLKEYRNSSNNRIVYLNDGDEFQIQIFNPYSYVVGVSISFNSFDDNSYKLLVLKPGERVWLDRYLDSNNKFKFNTYNVDNTKEVKRAIENNGNLYIRFYKENNSNKSYTIYTNNTNNNWWHHISYPYDPLTPNDSWDFSGNPSTITSSYYSAANIASTPSYEYTYTAPSICDSNTIETGRVEKGSYSTQNFDNYYGDFETYAFKTEIIKILPMSQKQINSNELTKRYCISCGRKIKEKFKFCPFCGTKI